MQEKTVKKHLINTIISLTIKNKFYGFYYPLNNKLAQH